MSCYVYGELYEIIDIDEPDQIVISSSEAMTANFCITNLGTSCIIATYTYTIFKHF